MKPPKTVLLIALSLFFVVLISIWALNTVKQNNHEEYLGSVLGGEPGISYHLYNISGEKTGYSRAVITIYPSEAGDTSKLKEIISHYFPEKSEEIFSNIQVRHQKLKNNWLEGEAYEYVESPSKKVWVKALDGQKPTVRLEFTIPV